MEKSFWLKKWEENQIGFHNNEFHPLLVSHLGKLGLKTPSRIFVPLCGKSLDLIYLASLGHQVIGLELSEKAILSFFTENKLDFEKKVHGPYNRYSCKNLNIKILQGDFFQLTTDYLGPIDFIYDRASLIALPSEMRKPYS